MTAPTSITLSDDVRAQVTAQARGIIEKHNEVAAKAKAAGNKDEMTQAVLANPPSAIKEIVKRTEDLYKEYEAALKERNDAVGPIVLKALEKSGADKLQAEAQELAKQAKTVLSSLRSLFGDDIVKDLPELKGARKSAASTDPNKPAIRRYRGLDVYVNGEHATQKINGEERSSLSAGAKLAGVSTEAFRNAFTTAAGSDDPEKFPERTEFELTSGEGDAAKTYNVVVTKSAE